MAKKKTTPSAKRPKASPTKAKARKVPVKSKASPRAKRKPRAKAKPKLKTTKAKGTGGNIYTTTEAERISKGLVICSEIAKGATVAAACKTAGVRSDASFYLWKLKYKPIEEAYKSAKGKRVAGYKEITGEIALSAFQKYLSGHKIKQVKRYYIYTTTEDPVSGKTKRSKKLKSEEINEKELAPSPALIIFALKNIFPEDFKDVTEMKVDKLPDSLEGHSIESLFVLAHGREPNEDEAAALAEVSKAREEIEEATK